MDFANTQAYCLLIPFYTAFFLAGYLCVKVASLFTGIAILRPRLVRCLGGLLFLIAGNKFIEVSWYALMALPLVLVACILFILFIWMTDKPKA